MTGRERVLTALAHKPTDRVPRLLYEEVIGYAPAIAQLLHEHCGTLSPRDYFQMDLTRAKFNPTTLPPSRFEPWLAGLNDPSGAGLDEWIDWLEQERAALPRPTLRNQHEQAHPHQAPGHTAPQSPGQRSPRS